MQEGRCRTEGWFSPGEGGVIKVWSDGEERGEILGVCNGDLDGLVSVMIFGRSQMKEAVMKM